MTALRGSRYVVRGKPVAKGRPRLATIGGHARAYTPPATREWEADAVRQIMGQIFEHYGRTTPVEARVIAIYGDDPRVEIEITEVPEDGIAWRLTRPDVDNLAKAALDALVRASVLEDDCSVVRLIAEKRQG